MTIEQLFRAMVALITTPQPFGFYYGEKGWQNLSNEDTVYPIVSVDFISSLNFLTSKSNFIGEKYPASVYFGYKSEVDWTTQQHEEVIQKATSAARNFISIMQNFKDASGNKLIDNIEITKADRVILRPSDDIGTSGILLSFNFQPVINLPVCVS